MNNLILYPLLVLFILGAFNQILAFDQIDMTTHTSINDIQAQGNQSLNGNQTNLAQETTNADFSVGMTTGLIILIITLIVVGVVAGIRVLGSGLSEFSVNLIYKATAYYGLWGIFSTMAFTAFQAIPFIGLFLWMGLTLLYTLGFFQSIGKGEGQ